MDTDHTRRARRNFVGGVATGALASVIGPAAAQAAGTDRPGGLPPNPVTQYPQPPFEVQQ